MSWAIDKSWSILQSFSYFETFWCSAKFSFHHKWNDAQLLPTNMFYTSWLVSCKKNVTDTSSSSIKCAIWVHKKYNWNLEHLQSKKTDFIEEPTQTKPTHIYNCFLNFTHFLILFLNTHKECNFLGSSELSFHISTAKDFRAFFHSMLHIFFLI